MEENKNTSWIFKAENILAYLTIILLALIPVIDIVMTKVFHTTGIRAASGYIKHLVLWVTIICGMITTRENKHLSLSIGINLIKEPYRSIIRQATSFISVAVSCLLTLCSLTFTFLTYEPGVSIGIVPIWLVFMILPLGFLINTIHFIRLSPRGKMFIPLTITALLAGLIIGINPFMQSIDYIINNIIPFSSDAVYKFSEFSDSLQEPILLMLESLSLPFIIILLVSTAFGTPIFILFSGLALFLFLQAKGVLIAVPYAAYEMLKGEYIATIPLFTLAGFILSESRAGDRLIRLFTAFLGWIPGGMAIIAIIVCAFFTTFTGASGVTILALGGLLSYMMIKDKYNDNFTTGLLTASGSIGLLFPPSLPIIMYAVTAQIDIRKMFVGGILPSIVMVGVLVAIGIRSASRSDVTRSKFKLNRLLPSLKISIWEILFPVLILVLYFGGITTLVQTSAIAVVYVLVIALLVNRDIKFRELPDVLFKCIPLIGGVLIILATAKGFNAYLVDAEVPMKLIAWFKSTIESKYIFLLLVNVVLLITGCIMEIFSAIIVVAPLIIPLGEIYGIHPVHLGIIFLANLQLGYLTPPVGMNLFLASYRFEKPLIKIYKDSLPFFLLLLGSVLVITYIPFITTWLVDLIKF
jgi:C4-dicarboxylate transporter DctM subunit